MQRLNLVPPDPKAPSPVDTCVTLPKLTPEALNEVQRRTGEILQSGPPEWIFVGRMKGGLLTFRYAAGKGPAMLLFATPFAALDYLRSTHAPAEVGQLKFGSLSELARGWMAAGSDTFVLNRCPRCTIMNVWPMLNSQGKDIFETDFLKIWALDRATKSFLGQLQVQKIIGHLKTPPALPQARAALETIRDHIDPGIPYVHQMIALIAGMQSDEAAKAAAIQRLSDFGPKFAGKGEYSVETLAAACVGLAASYGILKPQAAASSPPVG